MAEKKELRTRLAENGLTFVWLVNVLRLRGVNTDKSEMSSVVNGTRPGTKANTIVDTSHIILDEYEKFLQSVTV